jgi:hypothetical protein
VLQREIATVNAWVAVFISVPENVQQSVPMAERRVVRWV